MTLDELFEILDCYVEQSYFNSDPWNWRYSTNITSSNDILTTDVSNKKVISNNGTNTSLYADGGVQLESRH